MKNWKKVYVETWMHENSKGPVPSTRIAHFTSRSTTSSTIAYPINRLLPSVQTTTASSMPSSMHSSMPSSNTARPPVSSTSPPALDSLPSPLASPGDSRHSVSSQLSSGGPAALSTPTRLTSSYPLEPTSSSLTSTPNTSSSSFKYLAAHVLDNPLSSSLELTSNCLLAPLDSISNSQSTSVVEATSHHCIPPPLQSTQSPASPLESYNPISSPRESFQPISSPLESTSSSSSHSSTGSYRSLVTSTGRSLTSEEAEEDDPYSVSSLEKELADYGVTERGESRSSLSVDEESFGKRKINKDVTLARQKGILEHLKFQEIIHWPMADLNSFLESSTMSEAQINIVRDIRRRGKNKTNAQTCRKRKQEELAQKEVESTRKKEELANQDQILKELSLALKEETKLLLERQQQVLLKCNLNPNKFLVNVDVEKQAVTFQMRNTFPSADDSTPYPRPFTSTPSPSPASSSSSTYQSPIPTSPSTTTHRLPCLSPSTRSCSPGPPPDPLSAQSTCSLPATYPQSPVDRPLSSRHPPTIRHHSPSHHSGPALHPVPPDQPESSHHPVPPHRPEPLQHPVLPHHPELAQHSLAGQPAQSPPRSCGQPTNFSAYSAHHLRTHPSHFHPYPQPPAFLIPPNVELCNVRQSNWRKRGRRVPAVSRKCAKPGFHHPERGEAVHQPEAGTGHHLPNPHTGEHHQLVPGVRYTPQPQSYHTPQLQSYQFLNAGFLPPTCVFPVPPPPSSHAPLSCHASVGQQVAPMGLLVPPHPCAPQSRAYSSPGYSLFPIT